jgi:hypothetical protein
MAWVAIDFGLSYYRNGFSSIEYAMIDAEEKVGYIIKAIEERNNLL